jgi:hypothetical protein
MILHQQPHAAMSETHGFQEAIVLDVRRLLDAQGCLVPLHSFDAGREQKPVRIRLGLGDRA